MTGSRSKKNRAETSALPTLAQVESEQFNNKRCKFCEASVFCSKTCLPSSCAMLLFCRRSSKIIKSFHSCSEVFWIIARSRVGVAKKQEQGESTWRKHLGNACMWMLCLPNQAKGTDRGWGCCARASSGCSKSCRRDTLECKRSWWASHLQLHSFKKETRWGKSTWIVQENCLWKRIQWTMQWRQGLVSS